ncbi:unnamed protein product, partial [Polarella glacialis]
MVPSALTTASTHVAIVDAAVFCPRPPPLRRPPPIGEASDGLRSAMLISTGVAAPVVAIAVAQLRRSRRPSQLSTQRCRLVQLLAQDSAREDIESLSGAEDLVLAQGGPAQEDENPIQWLVGMISGVHPSI